MVRQWPDPTDTAINKREAIARALFDIVMELDPPRALRIRALAEEFELWFLSPLPHVEPGQRVDDALAARLCGVEQVTIRGWVTAGLVTRHPDGLEVGELLACNARPRRRRGHR